MATRVLLAMPATSYRLDAFVAAAAAIGVELVLATDRPDAFTRRGLACLTVDFTDPAGSAQRCDAPLDGVVAVDERSARVAAAVAARLGLRHHTSLGVAAACDKRRMRASLRAVGVAVPDFVLVPSDATIGEAIARVGAIGFPCELKPPMLSASQGVIRCDDEAALARALVRIRSILARHPSDLRADAGFFELVAERYVDGEEVAVEGLMHDGALQLFAIFDKPDPLCGPYFEETLYVTPSRKPAAVCAALADTAERAARALGLTHGPVHAELRVAERPVLIEIAARSIGGLCSRALRHVLGSLEQRLLLGAIGVPPEPLPLAPPASGVMMVPVPRSGVLRAVGGIDEARAVPHVDAVELTLSPGDAVRALPDGASYLGFIFAHAPSAEAVERALRQAHGCLRIELKPLLTQALGDTTGS